jgi:hypothetical protein
MMSAVPVSNPSSDRVPVTPTGATVAALADALRSEARLLGDLVNIMHLQRASVARDDIDGVDDSVFATHRILVTLGEARRRRRSLNRCSARATTSAWPRSSSSSAARCPTRSAAPPTS